MKQAGKNRRITLAAEPPGAGPVPLHRYGPLYSGVLLRRYKRFLVDVELGPGRTVAAFCPNSGSMKGCSEPGSRVMLSASESPGRKTRHTLEMVMASGHWTGVNTLLTNTLALRLMERGLVEGLAPFEAIRREVVFGDSRLDFLVTFGGKRAPCYVEVKNVTLRKGARCRFPDAVTVRGLKHLRALMLAVDRGYSAAMLYMATRGDCSGFSPAGDIDPAYAEALGAARRKGVGVLAYGLDVSPGGIYLSGRLVVEGVGP
jgi:sugar fermentation stimulation protein A